MRLVVDDVQAATKVLRIQRLARVDEPREELRRSLERRDWRLQLVGGRGEKSVPQGDRLALGQVEPCVVDGERGAVGQLPKKREVVGVVRTARRVARGPESAEHPAVHA